MSSPQTPKLPTKVQVGGISYKLQRNKDVLDRVAGKDEWIYGLTDFDTNMITLHPNIGEREKVVLLHELIHAVWMESGLRGFSIEDEEVIVHSLSSVLLDSLKRNKGLVEYLMS